MTGVKEKKPVSSDVSQSAFHCMWKNREIENIALCHKQKQTLHC